ncbi:MAG: RMD1 family protein [Candidatus Peregrinibacteria bacterium]|nr:RMD1 family protein [Candidatus Peregrinibacteria bacterium]MDZ4244447.1 RMD1 family protein [Candidatus Gracilibacteria bacterium]
MQVHALHLGRQFHLREIPTKLGVKASHKDPLIIEYGKGKYVVLLKYGVAVFWNFSSGEVNEFSNKLREFLVESFEIPMEEEIQVKAGNKKNETSTHEIKVDEITIEKIAVISLILGRSVALDHYDREVDQVLNNFATVMKSFAERGRSSLSHKELLKRVGFAMNVRHMIVTQMALLDKPDITWDDEPLDKFYNDLLEFYEIEERYEILSHKLTTIFDSVSFILDFLNSKRSTLLEGIIILLFVIDIIALFFVEFK